MNYCDICGLEITDEELKIIGNDTYHFECYEEHRFDDIDD